MLHTPAIPTEAPPTATTELRTSDIKMVIEGSLDHACPIDQMKAIDLVMRWYFKSDDWLNKRRHGNASTA